MMELIIHLLIKKSGSSSHIQNGKPNRTAIYHDVETLIKDEGISHKGMAKATFLEEISRVLLAAYDLDQSLFMLPQGNSEALPVYPSPLA